MGGFWAQGLEPARGGLPSLLVLEFIALFYSGVYSCTVFQIRLKKVCQRERKVGWWGGKGRDGRERWRSRVEITEAGASSGFLPLALGGPAVHKGKLFKYLLSLSFIHLIRRKGLLSCFLSHRFSRV